MYLLISVSKPGCESRPTKATYHVCVGVPGLRLWAGGAWPNMLERPNPALSDPATRPSFPLSCDPSMPLLFLCCDFLLCLGFERWPPGRGGELWFGGFLSRQLRWSGVEASAVVLEPPERCRVYIMWRMRHLNRLQAAIHHRYIV